jgi:hypothetical protein
LITSPLPSPPEITQPKRRKGNPLPNIPPQYDPLTEIIPTFPQTDPFDKANPNVRIPPPKDPFTNATPNVRIAPQTDLFTNDTPRVLKSDTLSDWRYSNPSPTTSNPNKPSRNRRNPQKPDPLLGDWRYSNPSPTTSNPNKPSRNRRNLQKPDPLLGDWRYSNPSPTTSNPNKPSRNRRNFQKPDPLLGDWRYSNPSPTTSNPNKPSRNRRNPKKPDPLRVNNRPKVEELYRKNPLIPAQKPNPNSVLPGKITSPNNGGQPIQAKKTPSNGGSQNSSSGGNSGQQQPSKKKKTEPKKLAKKYIGKDFDKLTSAEVKELEQGYKINAYKGKKYIQRKSEADAYPPLHLAEVNGKRVIAEGLSPSNRGSSSASTMKREFKTKFGEDSPKGDDLHHLIPVNVWKEDPIVQALEKKGEKERRPVSGVDDGEGLVSVPSNSNAMEDTHQKLEQKGGRVKIAHPSSHSEWDKHVKELSRKERDKLLSNRKYEKLEDVPIEELEKSIHNIREKLRKDLLNAAKQIGKGNYNSLPSWIDPKYQLKPDRKKIPPSQSKKYPRLVQEKPTNKDIAEFRKTLAALKTKVGQVTQKHALYDKRTNLNTDERQFRTLGYSAILAVKDNDYSYGQPFVFQRKGAEVGIYRRGDYTQVAKIDLREGVISVDKQFNSVEDNWLAEQQKVVLAQAQETQKAKTPTQKNGGFEMG